MESCVLSHLREAERRSEERLEERLTELKSDLMVQNAKQLATVQAETIQRIQTHNLTYVCAPLKEKLKLTTSDLKDELTSLKSDLNRIDEVNAGSISALRTVVDDLNRRRDRGGDGCKETLSDQMTKLLVEIQSSNEFHENRVHSENERFGKHVLAFADELSLVRESLDNLVEEHSRARRSKLHHIYADAPPSPRRYPIPERSYCLNCAHRCSSMKGCYNLPNQPSVIFPSQSRPEIYTPPRAGVSSISNDNESHESVTWKCKPNRQQATAFEPKNGAETPLGKLVTLSNAHAEGKSTAKFAEKLLSLIAEQNYEAALYKAVAKDAGDRTGGFWSLMCTYEFDPRAAGQRQESGMLIGVIKSKLHTRAQERDVQSYFLFPIVLAESLILLKDVRKGMRLRSGSSTHEDVRRQSSLFGGQTLQCRTMEEVLEELDSVPHRLNWLRRALICVRPSFCSLRRTELVECKLQIDKALTQFSSTLDGNFPLLLSFAANVFYIRRSTVVLLLDDAQDKFRTEIDVLLFLSQR